MLLATVFANVAVEAMIPILVFLGIVLGIWGVLSAISSRNSRALERLARLSRPASLADIEDPRQKNEKLKGFVGTGQLGIFTNGYWGHPAMKLTPEVNLLAVVHYLQALEVQRYANKIVAILGSKSPHIQNVAVGGVANPLSLDSQSVLTLP